MSIKDVLKILDETHAGFVLLLCHQNADLDAICSAYALQGILKRLAPNIVVEIGAGDGISKLSKHVLRNLPLVVAEKPRVENAEVLVLVDTNTIQQLGKLAETIAVSSIPIMVVDHHAPHPETVEKSRLAITDENSPSTCEMIYQFFKQSAIQPTVSEAQAIFLGMAFDTRHFALANASTLKTAGELCDIGVNPQEILALLNVPMDSSERLARMKACRRAKLVKIGEWILAFSHVSAFQASAARALVDLGAHAAAVAGQREESVEVSFRCTREIIKATGIHLGKDIAKPLGELLQNGMGGGHAAAAGANGVGDTETALKHCVALFKDRLSKPA